MNPISGISSIAPAKNHNARRNIVFALRKESSVGNFATAQIVRIGIKMKMTTMRSRGDGRDMPYTDMKMRKRRQRWIWILTSIWRRRWRKAISTKPWNLSLQILDR